MDLSGGIRVTGAASKQVNSVLTSEALNFLADLSRQFSPRRAALLQDRTDQQAAIVAGHIPDFLVGTEDIRKSEWRVANVPDDLQMRRVEITGPVERKMMINALNSGANVFMADLEDSLSPTWDNVIDGQINLLDAVRRTIEFTSAEGKSYRLNAEVATLVVRPRGWHLPEKHLLVDGEPISASLFDFGLYFFHNAHELIGRGTGPYFYLPKLESHHEARLWNDVFNYAQDALKVPRGTIRATVLVETILAAFEMEEILYELRDHAAGLNAGRWDYIFSAIKKFSHRSDLALPDRVQVTMTVPFMRAYTELLVKTCHCRGAHAIGGMAAFIPSRRDVEVNRVALARVREDKDREAHDGFDGTWVAHPDLVPIAREEFDKVLGEQPHQKSRMREEVQTTAAELLNINVPGGSVTEAGVRNNISVALQYLDQWLNGSGAAAIYNLMEDAATAEISRAQLWQWVHHGVTLDDGRRVDEEMYKKIRQEELSKLEEAGEGHYREASELLDNLVLSSHFAEFLTLLAYGFLK